MRKDLADFALNNDRGTVDR